MVAWIAFDLMRSVFRLFCRLDVTLSMFTWPVPSSSTMMVTRFGDQVTWTSTFQAAECLKAL